MIDAALQEVLDTFGGEIVVQIPAALEGPEAAEALSGDGAGVPGAPLFLNNTSHKQKIEVVSSRRLYWKRAVKSGEIVEVCEYSRAQIRHTAIKRNMDRVGRVVPDDEKRYNRMSNQFRETAK